MNLQMTLLLVSFFVTVVAGAIIIPILQKLKVGQNERDDGPKSHLKKQGTPTMGGIMMIAALIIVGLLSLIIGGEAINGLRGHILALLFVPIGFGVVGFLDDYIKLVLKNTKDILVIAGKGHEMYQEVNGEKIPFDERELVKEFVKVKVLKK